MSAEELKRRTIVALEKKTTDTVNALLNTRYVPGDPAKGGMTVEQYAMFVHGRIEHIQALKNAVDIMREEHRKMENPDPPAKETAPRQPAY